MCHVLSFVARKNACICQCASLSLSTHLLQPLKRLQRTAPGPVDACTCMQSQALLLTTSCMGSLSKPRRHTTAPIATSWSRERHCVCTLLAMSFTHNCSIQQSCILHMLRRCGDHKVHNRCHARAVTTLAAWRAGPRTSSKLATGCRACNSEGIAAACYMVHTRQAEDVDRQAVIVAQLQPLPLERNARLQLARCGPQLAPACCRLVIRRCHTMHYW